MPGVNLPVMTQPLIVSIIALVLSLASLSWQAYSWFRTGPVVKVKTGWAVGVGGIGGRWVHITVRNSGRSPVQVTGCSFDTPTKMSLIAPIQLPGATPLPY